jgi:predicted nucleotidyltransferase
MARPYRIEVDRVALWEKFRLSYAACPVDKYGNHPCDNGMVCHRCDNIAIKFEGYVEKYIVAERLRIAYIKTFDNKARQRRNYY